MKLVIAGLLLAVAGPVLAYEVPAIEPVYGVSVSKAGVTVRLASNGCTKKSDLTVAVVKNPPRPLVLIARKHPDTCRSLVAGRAEITWTFEDLGLDPSQPFSIANPLTADPGPP